MENRKKRTDPLDCLIAANMRRLRKARGWSQATLASRYGCIQAYIAQLENCHRGIGAEARARLAQVFGVDMEELWAPPPEAPDPPGPRDLRAESAG